MTEPTGQTIDGTPWEEPRPPHLPDRVMRAHPIAWLFVALAVVVVVADLPTLRSMAFDTWFLGQALLGLVVPVAGCLLGAVLFWRHADAIERLPLLVIGAVLSALVPVLRLGSSVVASFLEGLGPTVDMGSPAMVGTSVYVQLVSMVGVLALVCLAQGLRRAARVDLRLDARLVGLLVVISLLIEAIVALWYLRLPEVAMAPNTVTRVGAVVIGLATLLAWSYLVAVALAGRAAGERPARGWRLIALSGILAILSSAAIALFGFIQTDAVRELFLAIGLVSAASGVALLAGFAVGTPVLPPLEADSAATPDPPAVTTPGSAGS